MAASTAAGEVVSQIPFVPERFFIVFDVPTEDVRGEHAHRECHQRQLIREEDRVARLPVRERESAGGAAEWTTAG